MGACRLALRVYVRLLRLNTAGVANGGAIAVVVVAVLIAVVVVAVAVVAVGVVAVGATFEITFVGVDGVVVEGEGVGDEEGVDAGVEVAELFSCSLCSDFCFAYSA